MSNKTWICIILVVGLVVGFTLSLLLKAPRDIVAGGGILATFIVASVGWIVTLRKIDSDREMEEKKLQADLHEKYKFAKIREFYDNFSNCVKVVHGLNHHITNQKMAINEAEKEVNALMYEEIGIRPFLDNAESRRITEEGWRACAKERHRQSAIYSNSRGGNQADRQEHDDDPHEFGKKVSRVLYCLGKILNPKYSLEDINIGPPA